MPKKEKDKQESPHKVSNGEIAKHEPVIQDRIKGMAVGQLAKKHSYSRQQIRNILDANAERIEAERAEYLKDRQEKIDQALNLDIQEMAAQLYRSTQLLGQVIDRIEELLSQGEEMKARDLAALGEVAVKAFDRVHAVALNQQKESEK